MPFQIAMLRSSKEIENETSGKIIVGFDFSVIYF